MDELTLLRRAVLTEPDCDTARLVYSDKLEEEGYGPLARYIRRQVQIGSPHRFPDGAEAKIVAQDPDLTTHLLRIAPSVNEASGWTVRRGFVESVRCTLEEYEQHAGEWFGAHPLTTVTLTNREPDTLHNAGGWFIWMPATDVNLPHAIHPHWVPAYLREGLLAAPGAFPTAGGYVMFRTKRLALDGMSLALVNRGRSLVGLPPLGVVVSDRGGRGAVGPGGVTTPNEDATPLG